jgi:hypothetical protein
MSVSGHKRPKLPRLLAAKSATEQRGMFVPTSDICKSRSRRLGTDVNRIAATRFLQLRDEVIE